VYTSSFLREWWTKALRRRVLHKALDQEDRAYLYLTMRVLDRVRSIRVGRIIVGILAKLKEALESPFIKAVETQGITRARRIAAQAVKWGYKAARAWASDLGFASYLTLIDVNKPSGWGVL